MKLTTMTMVTMDGVMQGLGTPDQDRRAGFECGEWSAPNFDEETGDALGKMYGRADAFLFGRWAYELFTGSWGALDIPENKQVAVALNTKSKFVVCWGVDTNEAVDKLEQHLATC